MGDGLQLLTVGRAARAPKQAELLCFRTTFEVA